MQNISVQELFLQILTILHGQKTDKSQLKMNKTNFNDISFAAQ